MLQTVSSLVRASFITLAIGALPVTLAQTPEAAKPTEAAKLVRTEVKGLNDWTGYIEGTPAADSKLANIQIGMTPEQVQEIVGKENRFRSYPTAKNLIPFFGSVGRFEAVVGYDGLGRIKYTAKGGFLVSVRESHLAFLFEAC